MSPLIGLQKVMYSHWMLNIYTWWILMIITLKYFLYWRSSVACLYDNLPSSACANFKSLRVQQWYTQVRCQYGYQHGTFICLFGHRWAFFRTIEDRFRLFANGILTIVLVSLCINLIMSGLSIVLINSILLSNSRGTFLKRVWVSRCADVPLRR